MLPEREHEVVTRAMSHMPQDRFSSCADFIESLANINVF
jgi:hypothetical protein